MSNKVKLLPNNDKDEMVAACEAMKRQLPVMIEYAATIAKLRKAYFDAHLAEGFSAEQALELCKSIAL